MKRWLLVFFILVLLLNGCAAGGQGLPPLLAGSGSSSALSTPTAASAAAAEAAPTAAQQAASLQPGDLLPLDPAVRTGKLENGLAYYIQHNAEPAQRADLWLAVNAGSALEEDDQQGLAHFLEHMLFNGTRHFPAQALIDYLESTGMEFGPDVNAYTSFDETVYTLQAPTDDEKLLQTAFDVMVDWAAYATLDPKEIDAERGVVVEEWRLREQNAEGRIQKKTWPLLTGGSRYEQRLPIGQMDVVLNAPPEAIRRFYQTWYRPDLTAVIAVGDFDVDEVEALIRERFSALPAPASPAERPVFDVPPQRGARYLIVTDPEYPYTEFQIEQTQPSRPTRTMDDMRRDLASNLFDQMLDDRFDEISRQDDAPFVYAYTGTDRIVRPAETRFLRAQVQDDGVLAGWRAALIEVERVRRHGFTATELARAKENLLRAYQRFYEERDNVRNETYAAGYLDHFLTGESSPSVPLLYELAQRLLSEITLDEVNGLAAGYLAGDGRAVIVAAPEKKGVTLPAEDELAAVLEEVAAADVTPYEDATSDTALMAAPPAPAAIVDERTLPELGITEITLANGVRVVMKPTDFRQDQVVFTATSPGGSSLLPDEDYPEAAIISGIVGESGAGQLDKTELQKLLAGKVVGVGPGIDELSEGLGGYASPKDLETLMQLIYLYVTQPRVDETAFQAYLDQQRAFLANRALTPRAALEDALTEALYGKSIRRTYIPLEVLEKVDLARALEIYRDRFADMGDATFVFVGNFDVEQLKALAQTYLGTLPAGGRQESWRDVAPASPQGVVEKKVVKGQEDQAITQVVFSGPIDPSEENQQRLSVLEGLLSIRLREELREARGGTYAPFVSSDLSVEPRPEYSLSIGFSEDPDRVDELAAAVFDLIADLQANGPSQEDLDKVKEQERRNRQEALENNYFWMDQLSYYLTTPGQDVADLLKYDERLEALSVEDVQAAARDYLPLDRYVKVVLYPEAR